MLGWLKKPLKILGGSNDRAIKRLAPVVESISVFENEFSAFTDAEIREYTDQLKSRFASGEVLDDILPAAFALVREAARRTIGQRHFDVQMIGGIALHQGKIAEMKTGEGKTLVATLPVFLNALTGDGVHIITVNDYLARRDPVWMGPIYDLLGLTVGCLQHESAYVFDSSVSDNKLTNLRPVSRKEAYNADVTYGTNNEFGFDYLRDNMAVEDSQRVQKGLNFAIVDEVDNILIDEARTPLIISGPADEPVNLYHSFSKLALRLDGQTSYTIDEKTKTVSLTQEGISQVERSINVDNLYSPDNYHLVQYLENAVRAHVLYRKDKEYVVRDGEVVIVDEFTGRLQFGRRYSDGLHQSIEAKEGVRVQKESVTYATITLQNYFRMYDKLSGMTGTASTESEEFFKIYNLDVIEVPTNNPMIRVDHPDVVYATEDAKWRAVIADIEENNKKQRPILVGVASIEKSEKLSGMLKKHGIKHSILNAKQHETEAGIIAQAGSPGSITVATNMAGRGTDIVLGGNVSGMDIPDEQWEVDHDLVISLGGLYVLGTEHHDARRIDNQLRGRSGRQGDPGSSRFYSSLDDDVINRFGGERIKGLVIRLAGEDTPIENRMVTRTLANAQIKVEGYHFDIRKHLLNFDDVLNRQREVIYNERGKALDGSDIKETIKSLVFKEMDRIFNVYIPGDDPEHWDIKTFIGEARSMSVLPEDLGDENSVSKVSRSELSENIHQHIIRVYDQIENSVGSENLRTLERMIMLRTVDGQWLNHLTSMENLRQGIGLHAVGQRDPLVMYRTEGHRMFEDLLDKIQHQVVRTVLNVDVSQAPRTNPQKANPQNSPMGTVVPNNQKMERNISKIGRNDPCSCGSGKKYKRCHGV